MTPHARSPSSPTPGSRRSTASCARSSRVIDELRALGHTVELIAPDRFTTVPCPTYPEIRLALRARRASWRAARRVPARGHPYRDRGPARPGGAALLPARGIALHHRLSHALSRICRGALRDLPVRAGLCAGCAASTRPARGVMVATAIDRATSSPRAASRTSDRWSRGVDTELFRPRAKDAGSRPAAADLSLCRPRRGREEHRGVPGARPAGHQGGGRRRAAAAGAAPTLSRGACSSAPSTARTSPRHYAGGRRLRLPEPHRHVRPGDAGGAGLRHAGRGLSGHRARSTSSATQASASSNEDLAAAARSAIAISPERCRAFALQFSWRRTAEQFLGNLAPFAQI